MRTTRGRSFPVACPGCGGDIRPACAEEKNPALSVDRELTGTSTIGPYPARPVPDVAHHDPPRSADACRSAIGRPSLYRMSPITKSLIEELEHAPESVQREVLAFLRHLRARGTGNDARHAEPGLRLHGPEHVDQPKSRPRPRCEPKPGATMPASAATGSSAEASHGLRVGPHAGGHRSRERRRPARVTVPRHRSPPCGAGRRRHRAGCPPAR